MVQAKKPGDTMRDMEGDALVERLAQEKSGKKSSDNDRSVGRVTRRNAGSNAGGNRGRVSWQNNKQC